jgi:hypothetical protein
LELDQSLGVNEPGAEIDDDDSEIDDADLNDAGLDASQE